jgi:acetyl-CoA C-acetyltransferase
LSLDPSTPVLVGVGTAADGDCEASTLMVLASRAAAADATASGARAGSLLAAVDRVAVPQGTFGYPDPGRLVAAAIGAPGARTHLAEIGVPQQALVTGALEALRSGESEVALVVGGEARAWVKRQARLGRAAVETPQPGAVPDVRQTREPEFMARPEIDAGLVVPVRQYAMIENALRHAEGQSLAEHRHDVAALWARYNRVAGTNPAAAFPAPMTADELAEPGGDNFALSFPYHRWHASQWTVDQAAALLLCTAGTARRFGVPPDRMVFPLVGLDAGHAVSLSERRWLHRWPAMAVLGQAAAQRLDRPLSAVEVVEVYSCFPAAVRVQQRELGLPTEGTPTVTGGMAFAGGPFNNFTYQATHQVVARLRADPGALGLVTTVCGLLTKPGLAVWSATPDGRPPLLADLGPAAAAATPVVPVVAEGHRGGATVATYTVTYDDDGPARTFVIADTPEGTRCVAVSDDRALARTAVATELIGAAVTVDGVRFTH